MCGIVGFYHKRKVNEEILIRMTTKLTHRGPDDEGYNFFYNDEYQIGIGFRRLAIIDLSLNGHQPMQYKNLTITLNGEIYNFQEIKKTLQQEGYEFFSNTDTEVAIKAIYHWGIENALKEFIGMFAIALYDNNKGHLYLIRDRLGIKPLYYYYKPNHLVFASELKSIMEYPFFEKDINFISTYSYLYHGYYTSPNTVFNDVYKLEPGSFLCFDGKKLTLKKYWDLKEIFKSKTKENLNEEIFLEKLNDLLISSIKYRMISDVPIGTFLSGGIDSSLVTAIMQHLSSQSIKTFTIGFYEDQFNEAIYAKKISEYLGTLHHEEYLSIKEALKLIDLLPEYYDEPFGDSSALPTMLVSKIAKKNVTVALSGDGGDELFCGYKNYDFVFNLKKYSLIGKILNPIFSIDFFLKNLYKINRKLARYPLLNKNENIINIDYIISKYIIDKIIKNASLKINQKYFDYGDLTSEVQELYMLTDIATYLPDDILTKLDRASMSVSLEARVPLLDHRIVEFSFKIPHNLKYNNNEKKYILKKLVSKYIPYELLNRPKMGFAIPIFDWLKKELKPMLYKYLSKDYLHKQDIFSYEKVITILNKFEKAKGFSPENKIIWNLFVFQLWYEKYINKNL